jgi:putative transcriptional regulator
MGESSFFESVKAGLEEGIRFAKGELKLRTTEIADRPPSLNGKDVFHLRQQLEMTQVTFAHLLNVSKKTVQSWEQGERQPTQTALRLLQVLAADPRAYCRIVGVSHAGAFGKKTARAKVRN